MNGRIVGMTTGGDFGYTVGASLVFRYLKGEDMALRAIEVEAFGRRCRATIVERCAYYPSGERIRL